MSAHVLSKWPVANFYKYRYIKVFDKDRSDLASAYAHNAVFSFRVHAPTIDLSTASSEAELFAPKSLRRNLTYGN